MNRREHVTLVMIETEFHDLAKRTLENWTRRADWAEIIVFSDQDLLPGRSTWIPVNPLRDPRDQAEFVMRCIWPFLRTEYALMIGWDSVLRNPDNWTDSFFEFDHIGNIWPWQPAVHPGEHARITWWSRRMFEALRAPVFQPSYADTAEHHNHQLAKIMREQFQLRIGDLPQSEQLFLDLNSADDGNSYAVQGIANIISVMRRDVSEYYVTHCPKVVLDDLTCAHEIVASLVNEKYIDLLEQIAPDIRSSANYDNLMAWLRGTQFELKETVLRILNVPST